MAKTKAAPPDASRGLGGRVRLKAMPIASLKPAAYNPRQISDQALAGLGASIERWGMMQPVVWNERTGNVVGGHQRLKVLEARGVMETDVVVVDLDEAEEKAANVALNSPAISGEFTPGVFALLEEIKSALPDLSSALRMDVLQTDMSRLFPPKPVAVRDDDGCGALPKDPESRSGDVYVLGRHRVIVGSCTDPAVVARVTESRHVDLVVTSPPYNCGIEYDSHDDAMPAGEYRALIRAAVGCAAESLAGGRFLAWNVGVSPKTMHYEHASIIESSGLMYYREIVWEKVGVAYPIWQFTKDSRKARKFHPNYAHEIIYCFTKGEPVEGGAIDVDDECSRDIWRVHQSDSSRSLPGTTGGKDAAVYGHGSHKDAAHPAAFPVAIPAALIRHLTAPGERVLDVFCGSGSTIMAAEQMDRAAFGVELSPAYVDLIVGRWERLTGHKAERIR